MHQLPPLILHPFADRSGPSKLLDSSKAHLALRGMTTEEAWRTSSDLVETFLEGRYTEIRMLFYVGRDVCRWIQQCLEQSERQQATRHLGLTFESFADYLVNRPPSMVKEKLQFWGVLDFRSIFVRAIGLNSMFEECPDRGMLAPGFIREYHRFADALYKCRLGDSDFTRVDPDQFDFQLFASGEYAKLLEQQWG